MLTYATGRPIPPPLDHPVYETTGRRVVGPRSADSAGSASLVVRVWTTNGGFWTGGRTGRGSSAAR
ncbi:hypothetical protein [Streptomyces sp. NBC_00299]|uniref:hypothetical protein n=1 Tax=Streptomyces sp. NBC_00299 TaxID=2975705 RepID=UPI002E2BDA88|nr:hypothetical protein [Streptomyces sp. NBC_00299]